jgi:guanine deaminase|tara:strand:+ start:34 stop:546 length:513 start_codon:yes stop_codon:yes gene_type:complete
MENNNNKFNDKFNKLYQIKENDYFINLAIDMSNNSDGGPFGAIITNENNEIIAYGNNKVTVNNDPTAHAEIIAIRNACDNIKNFNLKGCSIYTSCEPCPMCLSAIYWARIDKIYYANTRKDAADIGFSDDFIYNEFNKNLKDRSIPIQQIKNTNALDTFNNWKKNNNIMY